MFWKKLQVSGRDKTPVPEVTKLRFKGALFSFALMQKNKKSDKSMPSKKNVNVSFVTSGTQKMKKKGKGCSAFAQEQFVCTSGRW